jgi:hypothetical protein
VDSGKSGDKSPDFARNVDEIERNILFGMVFYVFLTSIPPKIDGIHRDAPTRRAKTGCLVDI